MRMTALGVNGGFFTIELVYVRVGIPYTLQRTTNLLDWQSFRTNHPTSAFLLDGDPHPGRGYFYRAFWKE